MLALTVHDIEVFAPADQLVMGEKLDSCGRIILKAIGKGQPCWRLCLDSTP